MWGFEMENLGNLTELYFEFFIYVNFNFWKLANYLGALLFSLLSVITGIYK